jgi:hypothetical protein
MRAAIRPVAIAVLTSSLVWPGTPRAQVGWQEDLAAEIKVTQNCAVSYLSHIVERTVDGRQLVMAKAHCADDRVFDALRSDAHAPFQFNECQPDATQGC